jgi:KDO2-lipid IV(A) lauroyltransferase
MFPSIRVGTGSTPWTFRIQHAFFRFLRLVPYVIFTYIWPYRKKIILKNLSTAFPHLCDKGRNLLLKDYYQHLSNLFVESFLFANTNKKDLRFLVKFKNLDVIEKLVQQKREVIVLASHLGNWEYLQALPLHLKVPVLAAYSPLSNKPMDKLMLNMRKKYGTQLIPKQNWYKTILSRPAKQPALYIMIADQRPSSESKEKVLLYNEPTSIQCGALRLAQKRGAAVVYAHVASTGKNAYQFKFELMADKVTENDCFMQDYFTQLEQNINQAPSLWLWSHDRWKFN